MYFALHCKPFQRSTKGMKNYKIPYPQHILSGVVLLHYGIEHQSICMCELVYNCKTSASIWILFYVKGKQHLFHERWHISLTFLVDRILLTTLVLPRNCWKKLNIVSICQYFQPLVVFLVKKCSLFLAELKTGILLFEVKIKQKYFNVASFPVVLN